MLREIAGRRTGPDAPVFVIADKAVRSVFAVRFTPAVSGRIQRIPTAGRERLARKPRAQTALDIVILEASS